eukprot:3230223-Pyramimonas_sp.AAC.1
MPMTATTAAKRSRRPPGRGGVGASVGLAARGQARAAPANLLAACPPASLRGEGVGDGAL